MPQAKGDLQLAIGYWIVSHKPTLKKWWAITLLAFLGFSLIWMVVFVSLFFTNQAHDDTLVFQAASRLGRFAAGVHAPQDLSVGAVTLLTRDRQHVDAVAWLENPNTDWGAVKVQYHWQIDGQNTNQETIFINPAAKRPAIGLNIAVSGDNHQASITVDNVEWTRVGQASLPSPIFVNDALTISPTTITVNGASIKTVNLRATVTNRSVYNYYRVVVPVVLLSGDQIVAADLLSFDRWPTLTSRTIASSWPFAISDATNAQILPQVSQFDADNTYR